MLRFISIILYSITFYFAFKLLLELNINYPFVKITVLSVFAFLPTYSFISSSVNNDNLLILLSVMIMYYSNKGTTKYLIVTGLLSGLALLTKASAIVLLVYVITMLILNMKFKKQSFVKTLLAITYIVIIAISISLPFYLRNYALYNTFTGESVVVDRFVWKSLFHALGSVAFSVNESFWSVSGVYNNVSLFYPYIGTHILYLSIIGLLFGIYSKKIYIHIIGKETFIFSSLFALLTNIILLFVFGYLYNNAQGRHLYVMFFPILYFIASGFTILNQTRSQWSYILSTAILFIYSTSFCIYSLLVFTRH